MIDKQTLFILGAGASRAYGYPTGNQLRKIIIEDFADYYQKYVLDHEKSDDVDFEIEDIKNFSVKFDKSRSEMIDYFIAKNRTGSSKHLGKLAITLSIIDAEIESAKKSCISHDEDDWFPYLFQKMTSNILSYDRVTEIVNNKVSFITFNYDRSVEHFFSEAIKYNYETDEATVVKLINQLKIIHVFGRLPLLTVECNDSKKIRSAYGTTPKKSYIVKAHNSIKTLHERQELDKQFIADEIKKADRIFILGFGFADENLSLLNFRNNIIKYVEVYATSYLMSEKKIQSLTNTLLPGQFNLEHGGIGLIPKPFIANTRCRKLLEDYL